MRPIDESSQSDQGIRCYFVIILLQLNLNIYYNKCSVFQQICHEPEYPTSIELLLAYAGNTALLGLYSRFSLNRFECAYMYCRVLVAHYAGGYASIWNYDTHVRIKSVVPVLRACFDDIGLITNWAKVNSN